MRCHCRHLRTNESEERWVKGNENNRVNNRSSDRHTNQGKQTEPPTEAETEKWKKERGTDAVREMRERKGEKKTLLCTCQYEL